MEVVVIFLVMSRYLPFSKVYGYQYVGTDESPLLGFLQREKKLSRGLQRDWRPALPDSSAQTAWPSKPTFQGSVMVSACLALQLGQQLFCSCAN